MRVLTDSDIARALSGVDEGRLDEYVELFDEYLYSIASAEPGAIHKVLQLIDDDLSLGMAFYSFCAGYVAWRRSYCDK